MHSNAVVTFEQSRADVSNRAIYSFSAYAAASSVVTPRSFAKSLLLPINMVHMCSAPWSRSSFSHFSMFSKVFGFVISYTSKAPTAPL